MIPQRRLCHALHVVCFNSQHTTSMPSTTSDFWSIEWIELHLGIAFGKLVPNNSIYCFAHIIRSKLVGHPCEYIIFPRAHKTLVHSFANAIVFMTFSNHDLHTWHKDNNTMALGQTLLHEKMVSIKQWICSIWKHLLQMYMYHYNGFLHLYMRLQWTFKLVSNYCWHIVNFNVN
jgi:hypothetical protein